MVEFTSIDSLDFFDGFPTSPNGRYVLMWSGSEEGNGTDNGGDEDECRYVLFEEKRIIMQGKIQHPNDVHVANNGSFIYNDCVYGVEMPGTFYAIDRQGKVLVERFFESSILENGISPDGNYAICQIIKSYSIVGGKLHLFDLRAGSLLWTKETEREWASSFEFDDRKNLITVSCQLFGKFVYRYSGEIFDAEPWEGEYYDVYECNLVAIQFSKTARNILENCREVLDEQTAKEILTYLELALKLGLENYPGVQARTHRTIGEVFQVLGYKQGAIEHFEKALDLNPGVGVKRRLNEIKKDIRQLENPP